MADAPKKGGIPVGRFTLAVASALALGTGAGFLVDRALPNDQVREYLLEHPEVLPEVVDALQTKQAREQLAQYRDELETPFPGAVLGNPEGSVTLVEFADYACGYCRASAAVVEELIAENPDLRVVVREWAILSPASETAAKWALAAARQGKYEQFHSAMYRGEDASQASVEQAARVAGMDLEQARTQLDDPALAGELLTSASLARALGFEGTPAWVAGDKVLAGAVGKDALAAAIAAARN